MIYCCFPEYKKLIIGQKYISYDKKLTMQPMLIWGDNCFLCWIKEVGSMFSSYNLLVNKNSDQWEELKENINGDFSFKEC